MLIHPARGQEAKMAASSRKSRLAVGGFRGGCESPLHSRSSSQAAGPPAPLEGRLPLSVYLTAADRGTVAGHCTVFS